MGRKFSHAPFAKRLTFIAKLLMTIVGVTALLRHPIDTDVHTVENNGEANIHLHAKESKTIRITLSNQSQTSAPISITVEKGKLQPSRPKQSRTVTCGRNVSGFDRWRRCSPCVSASHLSSHRTIHRSSRSKHIHSLCLCAMLIKFFGVMSSAYAWHLLLRGQGIVQPYFQATLTAFLIGRFIGTFSQHHRTRWIYIL